MGTPVCAVACDVVHACSKHRDIQQLHLSEQLYRVETLSLSISVQVGHHTQGVGASRVICMTICPVRHVHVCTACAEHSCLVPPSLDCCSC